MRDLTTLVEPLRTWMTECQQSEMYTGVVERLERQLLQSKNPKKLLSKEKNHYTTILDHTGLEGRWVDFDLAEAFVKEELPDWKYRSDPSMIRAFCRSALLVDYIDEKLSKYEDEKPTVSQSLADEPAPKNIVFFESRVDLVKMKWFIGYYIKPTIRYKYEWAALWIYLSRQGLLINQEEIAFVKQMNLWYAPSEDKTADKKSDKGPCDKKTFNTYSKLSNLLVDNWDYQHFKFIIEAGKLLNADVENGESLESKEAKETEEIKETKETKEIKKSGETKETVEVEEAKRIKEPFNAQGIERMKMQFTNIKTIFDEKY